MIHELSQEDSRMHLLGSHMTSFVNVRKRSIEVNGQGVSYLERGEGIPVIFLHGFSCHKSNWRGVMSRFPTGYRIIAPDVPGFCLAQFNAQTRFSRQYFIDWLDGLARALEIDKFHLVAHSISTMIGIFYGAARREKLLSLTLANTPEFFMPDAAKSGGLVDEFFDSIEMESAKDWYQALSRLFYRKPSVPPVIREYNFNVYKKNIPYAMPFLEVLRKLRPQVMANSSRVNCQVILISSDHDITAPNGAESEVQSNFPGACKIHLKQCGHMSYLEKQTDFINGLYSCYEDQRTYGMKLA